MAYMFAWQHEVLKIYGGDPLTALKTWMFQDHQNILT